MRGCLAVRTRRIETNGTILVSSITPADISCTRLRLDSRSHEERSRVNLLRRGTRSTGLEIWRYTGAHSHRRHGCGIREVLANRSNEVSPEAMGSRSNEKIHLRTPSFSWYIFCGSILEAQYVNARVAPAARHFSTVCGREHFRFPVYGSQFLPPMKPPSWSDVTFGAGSDIRLEWNEIDSIWDVYLWVHAWRHIYTTHTITVSKPP